MIFSSFVNFCQTKEDCRRAKTEEHGASGAYAGAECADAQQLL